MAMYVINRAGSNCTAEREKEAKYAITLSLSLVGKSANLLEVEYRIYLVKTTNIGGCVLEYTNR